MVAGVAGRSYSLPGKVPENPHVAQADICSRCGHDDGSDLCCRATGKRTHAEVTRGSRTGERKRQALAKEARKNEALAEEAALRPREIRSVNDAQTPAQLTMAKMRERIAKKP